MNTFAIVIPYYKIDYFEETLKSVATQTCKDFTVYIGNDASLDDPLPLIKKYLRDLAYFYYDYKDNLGGKNLALQWERILDNVKEGWFQILGDDDLISENFVEEFYNNKAAIENQKSTAVRISHVQIDESGNITKDLRKQEKISDSKSLFYKQYTYEISSTLSENIFNSEVYRKKKFKKIPLAWGSDHLAIFDFADGNPIFYLPNALVQVRISDSSISGSSDNVKEKKEAYQIYRSVIISQYSSVFETNFIIKVFQDYRSFSYSTLQTIPNSILVAMLRIKQIKIVLSILKKNRTVAKAKRYRDKFYKSQNQYEFVAERYANTFIGTSKQPVNRLDKAPQQIFCFWTGENAMSENRQHSLESIKKNTGVPLILITTDNLDQYIVADYPLHKAFKHLSLVHKSDYLRGYFMYFYGGGYTDVKPHTKSWTFAFERLNRSENSIAIGYREEDDRYAGYMNSFVNSNDSSVKNINADLKKNYLYLIGNGSYIFKPRTAFWKEWLNEVHKRLDLNLAQLEENPGNILGDNEGYPLPWISILGEVFHPLCLKYHTELLYDDQLKPILTNYR